MQAKLKGAMWASFAGFAFFCIINPLVTILIAVLGFRMIRVPNPTAAAPFAAANTKNEGRATPLE